MNKILPVQQRFGHLSSYDVVVCPLFGRKYRFLVTNCRKVSCSFADHLLVHQLSGFVVVNQPGSSPHVVIIPSATSLRRKQSGSLKFLRLSFYPVFVLSVSLGDRARPSITGDRGWAFAWLRIIYTYPPMPHNKRLETKGLASCQLSRFIFPTAESSFLMLGSTSLLVVYVSVTSPFFVHLDSIFSLSATFSFRRFVYFFSIIVSFG